MTESTAEGPTILIVDDDDRFRSRVAQAFAKRHYGVLAASSGAEALQLASRDSPELALVDLRMPGQWGLHVVRELLRVDPQTKVVVLTAYGSIATAIEAMRLGAAGYLQKPASIEEIERAFLPTEGRTRYHTMRRRRFRRWPRPSGSISIAC